MIRLALPLCLLVLLLPVAISRAAEAPATAVASSTVQTHFDVVYADYGDRQMHLDLFVPTTSKGPLPAVLVIHGGGWLNGDKTKFHAIARALAVRGFVAAAVEYRLGTEVKFPAAVHDCNTATRWLRANAKRYGIDPTKIAAVGGSAGGHLVGLMASASQRKELQGSGNETTSGRLQAAVVMAGPMELATGAVAEKSRNNPEQSNSNRWLGKTVDEDLPLYQLASPLTHLSAETAPTLFMTGEFDIPERNLPTRNRLRELGVATGIAVYAEGKHGCWNREPWQTVMVNDIAAFLREHLQLEAKQQFVLKQKAEWGNMRFDTEGVALQVNDPATTAEISLPRLNNPLQTNEFVVNGNPQALKFNVGIDDWLISFPNNFPAEPATIRLLTLGRPYLPVIQRIVSQEASGLLTLPAHEAVVHGEKLRYEPQTHKNTIGYWANAEDWCEWKFYVEQPGTFELSILQGCGKGHGGSEVEARVGDDTVAFAVEDTGHFQNFKQREVGSVRIEAPGVYSLTLRAKRKAGGAVMDVRQVQLTPLP